MKAIQFNKCCQSAIKNEKVKLSWWPRNCLLKHNETTIVAGKLPYLFFWKVRQYMCRKQTVEKYLVFVCVSTSARRRCEGSNRHWSDHEASEGSYEVKGEQHRKQPFIFCCTLRQDFVN